MALTVQCPQCATRFSVSAALLGKTVRCTACHASITLPPTVVSRSHRPVADVANRIAGLARYIVAACVLLGLLFIAVLFVKVGLSRPSAAARLQALRSNAPIDPFPTLGNPLSHANGIARYQLRFPTGAPSSQTMTLTLLLPDRPRSPLPCIFVAPAGTTCATGNTFAAEDLAELVPYAQSGFAACGYSLDGPLADHPTRTQMLSAIDQFQLADAGLLNARRAMDFVSQRVPQVDAHRFYAAGHSSAGTLALLLAAREPRIKAVAAYCPCIDVLERNEAFFTLMDRSRPGTLDFVRDNSPISLAADMSRTPILLFGSRADTVVNTSFYPPFQQAVQNAGGKITLTFVNSGDHYRAMIDQGIPAGIAFFGRQDSSPRP